MKNIILAAMAVLSLTGSAANATSGWDYFWGTTLNPANTGWNDFWYQCQDPSKTAGDCVGTVAAGIGLAIAAPVVVVVGAVTAAGAIPHAATILTVLPMSAVVSASI